MAVHLFGAIDVGSYVYEMKIFELSKKSGIRQIDSIRHMVDIGRHLMRLIDSNRP